MVDMMVSLFSLVREGFRSRLETIVRGQVDNHSDSPANSAIVESRNDRTSSNDAHEIQNENREQSQLPGGESDIQRLLNQSGDSESNIAVEQMSLNETANQGENWREPITEDRGANWNQTTYSQFNGWRDGNTEDVDGTWRDNSVNNWPEETVRNTDGEESLAQEAQGTSWQGNDTREAVGNWSQGSSVPTRTRRSVPVRRLNRFHPPDDDNVYSMELRELLSR